MHQGGELGIAADKAREPLYCHRLQTPPDAARTNQLKDVNRSCDTLDGHGAQWRDLYVPFRQTQHGLGQ